MKVAVLGAGAIGGWMAVKLARAGHAVSVLARGATLGAIRAEGLQLIEGDASVGAAVTASDAPQDLLADGYPDLLIVAVKAQHLREAARAAQPLIGPDTIVLTAMNGVPWWFFQRRARPLAGTALDSVDPGGDIAACLPVARVVGCVVHASCSVVAPARIRLKLAQRLILGEPAGGVSARLTGLTAALTAAGLVSEASEDIQRELWYKLWGNMTMNPVSAITGATTDRILDDPLTREFCSAVMREAQAVGERIGTHITQTLEARHEITRQLGAMKTSMLQDAEAGRSLELDALVGAVVEIGGRVGVPTPHTNALFGLARLSARVRGLY